MMNLIQVQDNLKNFSQDQLVKEMQQPSGNTPQFLILSELNRRKRVKGDFEARQAQNQPTVAEEAVASAGVPQSGMMGMPEAMAPQSAVSEGVGTSAPMKMASGGLAQFGNEIRNSMGQEIDPYLDGVQQEAESKFNVDLNNNMDRVPPAMSQLRPAIAYPHQTNQRIPFNPGMGGKGMARPEPAVISNRAYPSSLLGRIDRGGSGMNAFGARGFAEGGVVRAANGLSLADRNMNPGNIRPAGFMGETGVNSGYSTYASPEFGLRAMSKLSDTYSDKGIGTVRDYINRYAPPSDNNENNEAYANMVAQALGVGVDDPVDFKNPEVKKALIPAMAQFEGYKGNLSPELINQGIAAGGTTDVTKANELLSGVDSFDPSNLFGINKRKVVYQSGEENKNSTSNVPKGVRPDFTIDSVPKNIREKKYLQELIKQRNVGKEQKRPILSDIISKNVNESEDYDLDGVENMGKNIDQKTLDLLSQPEKDFIQNNLFNSNNTIKNEEQPKPFTFEDTKQFRNILKGVIKPENYNIETQSLENILYPEKQINRNKNINNALSFLDTNYVGENLEFNAGANTPILSAEEFKKFQDRIESGKGANTALTLAGSNNNVDMSSNDFIKQSDQIIKEEKNIKKDPITKTVSKADTTALTSLEQELLNRQDQMKKDRDFDKYMALAQAGLSIMSSDNPTLAGAIGEGGTSGLTAFRDANKRYQEGLNDILNARVKLASKKGGLTQKDAITAISSIDSDIAKAGDNLTKAFNEEDKKRILSEIAQLRFQKKKLMPFAGYDYLSQDVSDSANSKS